MIRAGLQIPNFTYPGVGPDELFQRVSDIAVTAERAGFETVMVMDHFCQLPLLGPPDHEMLEGYTLLGALGGGLDWDSIDENTRALLAARLIVGDADVAGERIRDLVALGLDGVTFNLPAQGHVLENVEHAGEVATKALA